MNLLVRSMWALSVVFAMGLGIAAAEPPAGPAAPGQAPSRELREKMAAAHEKMAQCLRSERDIAECRKEMRAACGYMGRDGCPWMENGRRNQMMSPRQQAPRDY